jgi:hypothetical protein
LGEGFQHGHGVLSTSCGVPALGEGLTSLLYAVHEGLEALPYPVQGLEDLHLLLALLFPVFAVLPVCVFQAFKP